MNVSALPKPEHARLPKVDFDYGSIPTIGRHSPSVMACPSRKRSNTRIIGKLGFDLIDQRDALWDGWRSLKWRYRDRAACREHNGGDEKGHPTHSLTYGRSDRSAMGRERTIAYGRLADISVISC